MKETAIVTPDGILIEITVSQVIACYLPFLELKKTADKAIGHETKLPLFKGRDNIVPNDTASPTLTETSLKSNPGITGDPDIVSLTLSTLIINLKLLGTSTCTESSRIPVTLIPDIRNRT
jgi:hypothetical protein